MRRLRYQTYFFGALAVYAFVDLVFRTLFYLATKIETVATFYGVSVQAVVNALIVVAILEAVAAVSAILSAKYIQERTAVKSLLRSSLVCAASFITYGVYEMVLAKTEFTNYQSTIVIAGVFYIIMGALSGLIGVSIVQMRLRVYKKMLGVRQLERMVAHGAQEPGKVPPLTAEEIKRYARLVNDEWKYEQHKKMKRRFTFSTFSQAIEFVNQVALVAERENHHPNIDINFREVTIELQTHAVKGLSESDFLLAQAIESLSS